jgi:hypothetical protein
MPVSRTTKKSGSQPKVARKVPAAAASAKRASAATKSATARKAAAKIATARPSHPAHRKAAAVGSRTSRMLKDIHARGEQLTADINDLLLRIG